MSALPPNVIRFPTNPERNCHPRRYPPRALVSMATMIGVLPGAPRPRLPPERPPPREASSISTRPVRRLPASRSIITCNGLCPLARRASRSELLQTDSSLRMSLSQFEEAVGHWRGADGGPAETGRHGGEIVASIEAVGEFGQVAGDVLLADGPLGGGDGGLDVAERGVDPLEGGWPHRRAAGAGADRLMCASRIGDTAEASEAIADDGAGGDRGCAGPAFPPPCAGSRRPGAASGAPAGPRALVSMATMIGVLPGAPRPRLPPERPPPREASSISTRPVRRLPASRSIITCMSLCASFQAVFWVTPRRVRGWRSRPCSASGGYMARNRVRTGTLVEAKSCRRSARSAVGRTGTGRGCGS